ncbi:MAG: AAA family ATPase [Brevinema sp.]
MLTRISINNFRQFNTLNIENLKQINILVGQNNCGKTSVLEAIALFTSQFHPECFSIINNRKMPINSDSQDTLFHKLNRQTPIKISGIYQDSSDLSSGDLNISPSIENLYSQVAVDTNMFEAHKQLKYSFHVVYNGMSAEMAFKDTGHITVTPINNTPIQIGSSCVFLMNSYPFHLNLGYIINQIDMYNTKQQVIDLLSYFDLGVIDFSISSTNGMIYLGLKSFKTKVPLNTLGDGFIKYFILILILVANQAKYILIDEIENGLYWSAQKDLLRSIFKLSYDKNIQLFLTTHNLETLTFLPEIMKEESFINHKDDIQVINISKKSDKFYSFNHSMDGLEHFITTERDIR